MEPLIYVWRLMWGSYQLMAWDWTVPPPGNSRDHLTNKSTILGYIVKKRLGKLLIYAFYFSKTIYNTSKKIKNVANKKVFSMSLEIRGPVTSSRMAQQRAYLSLSCRPLPSPTAKPSTYIIRLLLRRCVSKVLSVATILRNDSCIYESRVAYCM